MAAEQSAQEFYGKLAELAKNGPLDRLYNELATMEDGHMAYLENMLGYIGHSRRRRSGLAKPTPEANQRRVSGNDFNSTVRSLAWSAPLASAV